MRAAILALLMLGGTEGILKVNDSATIYGPITVTPFDFDVIVTSGQAVLGPAAPDWMTNNSAGGLGFNADADVVNIEFEVPDCWDGTSDVYLKIYWFVESGDAIALNETVKWDFTWRSITWGTDDVDSGTVDLDTVTYTETANPGDDDDTHESSITLARVGGNQTIAAGDVIAGSFDRDVGVDTYSGAAIVQHWEFRTTQNKLKCDH
jgi:hypothetical protein